jgi:lipoprotein-anchoring transpeptidase ErfK/SrfK
MRPRTVAAGVLVVLVAGLVGLVARAAVSGGVGAGGDVGAGAMRGGGRTASLPAPVGGSTAFDPKAAQAGPLPRGSTLVATARSSRVAVHARPHGRRERTVAARREGGRRLPLVFSVVKRRGGWVKVLLPTRPNLSTGWLRGDDVTLAATPYRIAVRLKPHRLVLYRSGRAIMRAPIAKGRAVSPTPTGRYFVTDLLRPPDPAGFYGPYAFGLSAHSPVYTSFEGGDGQVGIHGTNQPQVLGQDVSHGCIRVSNAVITRLAGRVPLGTPVEITRG